jgi:hypothetical protein
MEFPMRKAIVVISFVSALVGTPCGQIVQRLDNESCQEFVERLKPDTTKITHSVIETKVWDSASAAIISFLCYDDPNDGNRECSKIFGHVYIPTGSNRYRDINFGPIVAEGGAPEIIAVFFANADEDKKKELIVLCRYIERHYDYSGTSYGTFIFDNPSESGQLKYFEELSTSFWGCECSFRESADQVAEYKTAKSVKLQLKKLGFK